MQYIIILSILVVFYILFEWNFSVYRRFSSKPIKQYPKISVLIPCRNEEKNIKTNVQMLLNQDYPDFEILVLDDQSTDKTADIVSRMAEGHENLSLLRGISLPEGWQGKNFACHQLSQAARGEWLLFVDADTKHQPKMLKHAMQTVQHRDLSLLSTFPRQRFGVLGDALVVPLMFFIVLMYLPMFFVSKKTWKWAGNFATACGQFVLVKRDAYEEVGGHAGIRGRISEGPLLATRVKNSGRRIALADGSPWVSCHMYKGFNEALAGFSRSLFASMGGSVPAFLFFIVLQTYVFIFPFVLAAYDLAIGSMTVPHTLMLSTIVFIPIWMRWRIHSRIGMQKRTVFLHPVSIFLYHCIMVNSFIHYRVKKNTVWKDRAYASPQA